MVAGAAAGAVAGAVAAIGIGRRVATVRVAVYAVEARSLVTAVCRTGAGLAAVVLVAAVPVSGAAVASGVVAGAVSVAGAAGAGAVSIGWIVAGADCVAPVVACWASDGVEESARAAAIAVAPSRALSLLWVMGEKPPFTFGGSSIIGEVGGNADQSIAAQLTQSAATHRTVPAPDSH